MSFDGLFTRAITKELSETLLGGRVNKIHQPYKNEIVINIRAKGKNRKLLLSAHPSYARVQMTEESYENPKEPPLFCMMLRKHLEGAILESVEQAGLDRLVILRFKGKNEIGDTAYKQLFVEIMGRHSNIVLVDENKKTIIDSVKHVSAAVNSYRTVLPGHEYVFPPAQDKLNPLEAGSEDVLRQVDFNSGRIDRQLVARFAGLSPLMAKEIVFQSGMANRETLPKAFINEMEASRKHEYTPVLIEQEDKTHFYFKDLNHLTGNRKLFDSLSELLDRFYVGKADRDRVRQQANDIERFIKNEKEKNEAKLVKLRRTLEEAENADHLQLYGELLTAHLYAVEKGMKEIEVTNYYDENGGTLTIPLDPQKTPSENAQQWFSKYQKAKNAVVAVNEQIESTKEEILYLDHLLQQIESASPKDIEEIREELIEEGYMKARITKKKKPAHHKPELETYETSDGTLVYVGKNNKQNDYLTNKLARRDDVWLHTKDIPGSHVVIRSDAPSEQAILEAANLAAYFSKAKSSSSVPVDFTKVRHVKKPSGAKPGFVIYDNQQTVYVTPNEDLVLSMKQ
ncbi:Rqc2 family fibronectin-binding protein [Bacillus thermotolerans]|uniref:Rqc2 family fibronectin-binding protein n=1 Tax=Bacillus thermotolerans TaxID=1221996 RepID=UPI00057EC429|nr:NFACT RNA binding domain-containing protein [Bacillus thermotolerans]KKB39284.1 Fibronectin/fibrinogen-binding protein [Bacillus thermotolerans]KKB43948.1 Fibronectin/fibrinogen-binding protein [Bacillus thermotolerans]